MSAAPPLQALRRRLRPGNLLFAARHGAGGRSKLELRRLGARPDDRRLVRVRLHPLGGAPVLLRPAASDPKTLYETFGRRYHLPPEEAGGSVMSILDLGANIGLTLAHLAHLYPAARVLGVEMDEEQAALAQVNVRPWSDRVEVRRAAVWTHSGSVRYWGRAGGEHGFRIEGLAYPEDRPWAEAPAVTLDELVEAAAGATGAVDYVKMDVEGAEGALLAAGGAWAARVRTIKVEVHEPNTVEECRRHLDGLGFDVREDPSNPECLIGIGTSLRGAGGG